MSCSSDKILKGLGYAYTVYKEPGIYPNTLSITFKDLLGAECDCDGLLNKKLYNHQYQVINFLSQGKSVIINASMGSGKTEAWLTHVLKEREIRALAIYPTKALANDQAHRIAKYLKCLGYDVNEEGEIVYGDVVRYDGDTNSNKNVLGSLDRAKVILTNPEMLLTEIKKGKRFLGVSLIVLDEVDFYESHSITLLISTLKLLFPKVQFVIISGTLSNPEDLKEFLQNAEIVGGAGFKPETRIYIVIGKEDKLRGVYNEYRNIIESKYGIGSYDEFKDKVIGLYYNLLASNSSKLRAELGDIFDLKKPDIEEILKAYKGCKVEVTIVFSRGINECDSYSRPLGIPSHHSKVKKKERFWIEKNLREGKTNIVFTVRTLQQGIDIGIAKRVIHLGIPKLVKDFLQREGRKGRSLDIDFVESVILPMGLDPRLIQGIESLRVWSNIKPEAVIFNVDSLYVKVYLSLIKKVYLKEGLKEDEESLLRRVGIIDDTGRIKDEKVLDKLKFYSITTSKVDVKYYDKDNKLISSDKIGLKDMIENYQPGSIDKGNNAVVKSILWRNNGTTPFLKTYFLSDFYL
ncbi:DEAD/DEAH box helicase [Acidianus sp. RZ1]|uniref:DEAD/DEAH box helicase n=1 Tax=Acidianus sp. RZ1 TaxID=1540082 RepID=UPI0014916433|nr:DEAD/DEAH box helicase [Acidianus sp. RZ1]NON61275.1 DEAD/DEAH box helicase [Acidianus sp. RZ1]